MKIITVFPQAFSGKLKFFLFQNFIKFEIDLPDFIKNPEWLLPYVTNTAFLVVLIAVLLYLIMRWNHRKKLTALEKKGAAAGGLIFGHLAETFVKPIQIREEVREAMRRLNTIRKTLTILLISGTLIALVLLKYGTLLPYSDKLPSFIKKANLPTKSLKKAKKQTRPGARNVNVLVPLEYTSFRIKINDQYVEKLFWEPENPAQQIRIKNPLKTNTIKIVDGTGKVRCSGEFKTPFPEEGLWPCEQP